MPDDDFHSQREDGQRAEWLGDPYTQQLRAKAAGEVEQAFQKLMSHCRVTTDPKVAASLAEYYGALSNVSLLTHGKRP